MNLAERVPAANFRCRFVEYQDVAFLKACGLKHLSAELKAFWPCLGPEGDTTPSVEF